jgi:hypothetical protein
MRKYVTDQLSTRTVVICFPDGETQYWLTDQVFSPGDTLRRNGRAWFVSDVLDSLQTGSYAKIRLRDHDGSPAAS